ELAQLEYNLPRMRGLWKHLERLGGGVGTRGPGESQLETDRRLARRRISLLKDRLRELSKRREQRRKSRVRSQTPTIALAGYTNVGKSTLLNALTGAEASIDDRLFETLDPTTRSFDYEGRKYLLTDTVGFIRRLPHELVEGFAATLEETLIADLVLHVVDASADEGDLDLMVQAVEAVLSEIGAGELPVELVLNKIDEVDSEARERLENRFPGSLQVSARTGEGLEALSGRIAELFEARFQVVELLVPYDRGDVVSSLYALGPPIELREDRADGVFIRARLPERELRRLAPFLVRDAVATA
ncbi:MAG: GTPase HflX, partial [Gaiellaceae bacterium]